MPRLTTPAIRTSLLLLIALGISTITAGQEVAERESADAPDAAAFIEAAKQYTITPVDDPEQVFQMVPKPLLTWSNPERSTPAGAVFLYTHRGVPQVAMCVYPDRETLVHEFQSLSAQRLAAEHSDAIVWAPLEAGIEMRAFESAPPPGPTPSLRLRQMRNISRMFEAAIVKPNFAPKPLRLLATPLYRYPPDALPEGVVDGALFSFVQATDPEVLLLVEAYRQGSDPPRWRFGLARMSMVPLSVRVGGDEVWRTEWAVQNATTTYYCLRGN